MDDRPKIGSTVLVGVIAAVTAAAWAATELLSSASAVPGYTLDRPATVASSQPMPVSETLSAQETVVNHSEPAPEPVAEREAAPTVSKSAPAAKQTKSQTKAPQRRIVERRFGTRVQERPREAITVERRRLTRDERIQLDVMERLASNPHLTGKIGVEARNAEVRLTGWTHTAVQARRAERDALGVRGVKYVRNEIRPRIGGSV